MLKCIKCSCLSYLFEYHRLNLGGKWLWLHSVFYLLFAVTWCQSQTGWQGVTFLLQPWMTSSAFFCKVCLVLYIAVYFFQKDWKHTILPIFSRKKEDGEYYPRLLLEVFFGLCIEVIALQSHCPSSANMLKYLKCLGAFQSHANLEQMGGRATHISLLLRGWCIVCVCVCEYEFFL